MVSSDAKDPTLGQGMAYFVNRPPYIEHVKHHVDQDEVRSFSAGGLDYLLIVTQISSCSGFAAMFLANLKRVKGLRSTGVGGVTCTRHNMWAANGIVDLQKGERYADSLWSSV